jgi:predicted enzyme related to lactoylglutathione lyase
MRLSYVMKFVADMERAVAFYGDVVGLKLRFQSPDWSEFDTGETTLALHLATAEHPAGSTGIGFMSEDLDGFVEKSSGAGVTFTQPPTSQQWARIARFLDCDGAEVSVSG